MNKKWDRWETTRAKGQNRFVWVNGVVGWGLTTGLVWPRAMSAIQGWDRLWVYFPLSLALFPIGGFFWGRWMWADMERKYHEDSVGDQESH